MIINGINYSNIVEFYSLLSRKIKMPFYGSFELTPRCNMNCKMCYIRMTSEEMKSVGTELSIDEWLRIAKEAVSKGMMHLLLTGGEAILYKDFKKLYLELRNMGLFVTINSNGTMLNDEWISFFKKYPPAQINITVYGGSNETYQRLCGNPNGFDQMKNAVENLIKNRIHVQLNCMITKQNVDDLKLIFEFGKKVNIPINGTTYCFPPVRKEGVSNITLNRFSAQESANARIKLNWYSINNKDIFYKRTLQLLNNPEYKDNFEYNCQDEVGNKVLCAAGRSNFWITWDGRMLPCGMIPDYSVPIKDVPFDKAWKEIVDYTASIRLAAECKNCSKKEMCSPCAAKLKSETGSYDKKSKYMCDMTDEYIRLLDKAKEYLENNK